MESKVKIDVHYATRMPQITIKAKHSDDPRDTLVSMFSGESMPGTNEGYCRIERYPSNDGFETVVVTPVHPTEMIKHIKKIAQFAHENVTCDTSEVPGVYRDIIESEYNRLQLGGGKKTQE